MVTSATANQTGANGATVSIAAGSAFTDPNTGDILTYAATGLPSGLTVNAATGAIAGTLSNTASLGGTGGVYAIVVTATDDKGAATSESFTLTASDVAPVLKSPWPTRRRRIPSTVSYATAASFANGGAETSHT